MPKPYFKKIVYEYVVHLNPHKDGKQFIVTVKDFETLEDVTPARIFNNKESAVRYAESVKLTSFMI